MAVHIVVVDRCRASKGQPSGALHLLEPLRCTAQREGLTVYIRSPVLSVRRVPLRTVDLVISSPPLWVRRVENPPRASALR